MNTQMSVKIEYYCAQNNTNAPDDCIAIDRIRKIAFTRVTFDK